MKEDILPNAGAIINLLGPQNPIFVKDVEGISIRVNYEWICQQILKRLEFSDVQDVIRILKELDAEQDKK